MLGDFLYSLTPRDEQTLLLEIRDFRIAFTIPVGSSSSEAEFSSLPLVPLGKIGIPISASMEIAMNGGATQNIIGANINSAQPNASGFSSVIAGNHYTVSLATAVATEIPLFPFDSCLVRDDEIVSARIFANAAATILATTVTAHLRMLFLPRGNIGV